MLFCILLLNLVIYIVNVTESLENSLSLSMEQEVEHFRLFPFGNSSIFDEELVQKFVIFKTEKEQKVIARFGDFNSATTFEISPKIFVLLHTDRHAFLIPTESNKITVNTLCEFFYDKTDMSFLDEKFCCLIEIHLNRGQIPNPTAICEMRLGPRPSFCFTPLTILNTFDLPPVVVITATVYRQQAGRCPGLYSPDLIYATSSQVSLSFSNRPPLIWQLTESTTTQLLLGLPLQSSRPGENIVIPLRLISTTANVGNQIISLQCVFDERINVLSIIPHFPLVSILNNFSFSNSTHAFHNIDLQMTPGIDRELFSLNATLLADSAAYPESSSLNLQCCIRRSSGKKSKKYECGRATIVNLLIEINSMIMIPALKTIGNMFNIYNIPNVTLSRSSVKVYGVLNHRDRIVSEVSNKVEISLIDENRIKIIDKITTKANIDLTYQNYINPWSMQLSIYDCRYTILSPVRIWKADSWRIVVSDDILRPIKNWMVPGSTSNGRICVTRFKVARLKILCRLYILEESGLKQYVGAEGSQNSDSPFVDVTDSTDVTQLRTTPLNVISLEKSPDNNYFLVTANEISQSASIELLSRESSQVLVSTHISVESDMKSLYVVDLIIHCIDALTLNRRNKSANSIKMPNDYETISVSMSEDSQSLPCYLLVFLIFSDKSIERVSSFDRNHYQMFLVSFEHRPISKTMITDGQLVTVKWKKQANISMFESVTCNEPKLIFTKKMNWGSIMPFQETNSITTLPLGPRTQITQNETNWLIQNSSRDSSISIFHISLYIFTTIVALCFLCFILHKIFCSKSRSLNQSTAPTCYNISDSVFIAEHNKIPIRNSSSKTFSLGKCSTNCMRQNNNKSHSNEPYPPLLPPPGPISANYDLTINDRVCCDSAVDSGIELGKLSSYSSTTNPSNDICCSIEQHMSTSLEDHHNRLPSQFPNPLFGYYTHKDIMESMHPYHNTITSKTISNLRPPQW